MSIKKFFQKKYFPLLIFLIGAIVYIYLYNNIKIVEHVTNVLIASSIFAYIMRPSRDFFLRRLKLGKKLTTILLLIVVSLIFTGMIIVFTPIIIREISNVGNIINDLGKYLDNLENKFKISDNPLFREIYGELENKIWNGLVSFSREGVQGIIEASDNIISFAIVPIVAYYFLSDGEKISNKIYMIVPIKQRHRFKSVMRDINLLLEKYIVSQFILCIFVFVISFIVFEILGLKFTLWISLINGVFNIVPYFGAVFGGIPAIVIGFLQSPKKGVYTAIAVFVIQQIEGNILAPKITADSTDIHPLIIIILLVVGEKLGGILGMIFIVPLAVIIKVIYDDLNRYIF